MNSLCFDFATTSETCNENVSLLSSLIPRSVFVQHCPKLTELIELGRARSVLVLYPTTIVQHLLLFNFNCTILPTVIICQDNFEIQLNHANCLQQSTTWHRQHKI